MPRGAELMASSSWKHWIVTFQELLFVSLGFCWAPEKPDLWISQALLITRGYPGQLGTGTGHTSLKCFSCARPMCQILYMLTQNPPTSPRGSTLISPLYRGGGIEALSGRKAGDALNLDLILLTPKHPSPKKVWWSPDELPQFPRSWRWISGRIRGEWETGARPGSCLGKMARARREALVWGAQGHYFPPPPRPVQHCRVRAPPWSHTTAHLQTVPNFFDSISKRRKPSLGSRMSSWVLVAARIGLPVSLPSELLFSSNKAGR